MDNKKFFRAKTIHEACSFLSNHPKAIILAGGSDLMVKYNLRPIAIEEEAILYIGDCGLDKIKIEGNVLSIGATVRHEDIIRSDLIHNHMPLLAEAIKEVGSPAIRNVGTIGGNLVNASPASDGATALLALDAKIKVVNSLGSRIIDLNNFFVGPKKTILEDNEILESVNIPLNRYNKYGWKKIGRRSSDTIAVLSVAISVDIDDYIIKNSRIALGSVAPTPFVAVKASKMLSNSRLDDAIIEQVASCVYDEIAPIDDVRATAVYRRTASRNVVKNILKQMI